MGAICVIVNKKGGGEAPEASRVGSMLAAAAADQYPQGGLQSGSGAPPAPACKAFRRVAAGALDALGGHSERGLYEDDAVLVACDAEIYNAKELEVGGPRGLSEAALIARLYAIHGEKWWEGVRGAYGVFIWDKAKDTGLLFTDRLGIRPIVYHEDGRRLVAATRLSSLAAMPGWGRELNHQAVFSYLYMEMIPTPFTLYRRAKKLEGGHFLRIRGEGVSVERAWNMRYPKEKLTDRKQMEAGIKGLMRGAVEKQAGYQDRDPGEVGAFLSGGTDSSLIAALLSEIQPGKAKTFSIGFDEPGYDEMGFARIASDRFKTSAHEYYVTQEDVLKALPLIIRAFDEPFANSSVIPTYFCALKAREAGVRVMLGGDGGDELFGGNSRYSDNYKNFRRFPPWVEGPLGAALGLTPSWAQLGPVKKAANYFKRKHAPLHERIHAYNLSYYLDDIRKIFAPEFLEGHGPFLRSQDIAQRILDQADAADELDRYLYHDLKNTLMDNDLRKVNTMTALAGVQARYPFLDSDLLEFTGLIPVDLKVRDGKLRYLYKETFKDVLPDKIINKTKHGFGIPVVKWMLREGPLHDMLRDALFDGRLQGRGIFRDGFVEDLYRRSLADKTTYFGSHLYYIFFLELWMREHFDPGPERGKPA